MAINWNALQAPPTPQTVAQVPIQNPNTNPVNQLAEGLNSGLLQGQQLSNAVTQNQLGQVQLQAAQKNQAYQASLDTAFKSGGMQGYRAALNPQDRMGFDKGLQEAQKTTLDMSKIIQETATSRAHEKGLNQQTSNAKLDSYNAAIQAQGQLYHAASMAQDPNQKQAIYRTGLNQLPEDIRKTLPQSYDDNTAHAVLALSSENLMNMQQQAQSKAGGMQGSKPTANVQDLALKASLEQKEKDGTLTQQESSILGDLKNQQAARSRGLSSTPAQQVNISTTTDRLKETGKNASLAAQTYNTLSQMEQLNEQAFSGRGAGVELKAKQFLNFMGVPEVKGVKATEVFNGLVKQAQLSAQTLLKGSSSDRDMEIVAETGPQLYNTMTGRKLMISAGKYKARMDQQYNAFLNAYQNKNEGSLNGADEAWNSFIQSRSDFDPKSLMFKSDDLKESTWKPFLEPGYTAPKAAKEFVDGSIYQDASGKKAKYVNGKWEEVQ